jgi:hypothetical protein
MDTSPESLWDLDKATLQKLKGLATGTENFAKVLANKIKDGKVVPEPFPFDSLRLLVSIEYEQPGRENIVLSLEDINIRKDRFEATPVIYKYTDKNGKREVKYHVFERRTYKLSEKGVEEAFKEIYEKLPSIREWKIYIKSISHK